MRTAVIVIGDLGRSPRMQYHALSLAAAGGEVDLVGLEGAPVTPAVSAEPRIHVHRLSDAAFSGRARGGRRRFVFGSALRAFAQSARLLALLMRLPAPDTVLVQNPPAFPTLFVGWLVARLRGARVVIDWHNLSHTIAAVKVGERHRAVAAIARSERRWARRADAHLAVSRAFAEWLHREYGIAATVVYDRPPAAFAPVPAADADALWARLASEGHLPRVRVPVVVCPTSWTPDEHFDLLLDALERADRRLGTRDAPALLVAMTGRGALREAFEARVARRDFKAIAVRTLWLEPADYPTFVGMADLGVCLHQSSSGLDLPMKLADLRGAGVPAAAYDYAPVLAEALTPGQHGVMFRDSGELADLLVAMASGEVAAGSRLAHARAWLAMHPPERWDDQWRATARAVLVK